MSNPFEVRVPDFSQALDEGMKSYSAVAGMIKERGVTQAREQAAQHIMEGGDPQNAFSLLLRAGDDKGLAQLNDLMRNKQQGDYQTKSLAQQDSQFQTTSTETARADRARESQGIATLAETRRQHDLDLGKPFKAGEDYGGQPIYLARDKAGNYIPVKLPDQQPGALPGQPQQPQQQLPGQPQLPPTVQQPGQPPVPQPIPAQPQPAVSNDPEEQRKAAFLESRPPVFRGLIKGIANYDHDERAALSRMPPTARARIISDVAEYDPTYSQANYPSIVDARKKFGAGSLGVAIRSFDVSIGHLEQLKGYAEALNNGNLQVINSIRNKWRQETGSDLPTNFEALKPIVSGEVTKAIIGSQNALSDREEFKAPLRNASSPAQFIGAIGAYQKAMAEQLAGTEKQYADTTRWKNFRERLRPETLKVLESHSRPSGGSSGATPAPPPGFILQGN